MQTIQIFYGFCILLILSRAHSTNILQPTWLSDSSRAEKPSDGTVRITPENLRETAEWRAIIQKAVNEGRYAVDIDEETPQFNPEDRFRPQPFPPPQFGPPSLAPFNPPHWPLQFEVPTMAPWLPLEPPTQPNPMQRMWSDFMENTRRMWEQH
ncbi:uncharacterized protein LOC105214640 isoform X1 [Zeugodacus cucurbitae]|uniref:uncharacterized protein LOC105214640 isoform X1 n=1 Tax=Zeugodacus cucurbitae TaxID=28588 RepID=UPI0023D9277E|nr:uncharacterized protein LOC105214640 isoform X1 [Zeugodacus cucurbitae]